MPPTMNSDDKNWRNKFATDFNIPCGLIYYNRCFPLDNKDDEVNGETAAGNNAKVFKIPRPVACRGVSVCGTVIDSGFDCQVSQIYEQRDEGIKRELYYVLPVDERTGVYRFEFKVYDPKLGSRDNEPYKVLKILKKDYVSSQSYEQAGHSPDSVDSSKRDFLKIRIGMVQPANVIQIRIGFISELGGIQDENHNNNGYNKLLRIPSIFFPNFGPERKVHVDIDIVHTHKIVNEEYSTYYDYPVNVMLRIFQQYLCNFKFLPAEVKWKRVQNRTETDAYSQRSWYPYTLLTISSMKSVVVNNLEIAIVPVSMCLTYKEPTLVMSTYRGQSIAMLSLVLDPETELGSTNDLNAVQSNDNHEVIFFLDQSGSMLGKSMQLAKVALETMLRSLPKSYMFNVIGYGSSHELFFKNSKTCELENLEQALVFLENACPTFGNNNLLEALNSLICTLNSTENKHSNIVIISDGHMEKFDQVLDLVKRYACSFRVFTVAVGDGLTLGTRNLERIAKAGLGFCEFIHKKEDAKRCVSSIVRRLHYEPAEIEKIEWGYQTSKSDSFVNLTCEDSLKENSLGYSGSIKVIYAAFKKTETLKNAQIQAKISLKDGRKYVACALEMPLEHVLNTGSTLLIHRLYVLNLISMIESQRIEVGEDISDENEVNNLHLGPLSASMNLMCRNSIMAIFSSSTFHPDNWVQDTRFGNYIRVESNPNNGCIVTSCNSKAQLSRLIQVGKPCKESFPDDFSIACLREMMVGKQVTIQEHLQQLDGSYLLDQEFAASIKMTYNYLTQTKRKTLSPVTWSSCIAFMILTNKLGVWTKPTEKIIWSKMKKTEEWLKSHASELDISATFRAALQVLWKYFSKESRY